ncbi:DUF4166 domain-containing protein [Pelagibius marinus]|uniref:DUF4166 domain-containing protein n=1 Tax=Pelagibius marinus TaxID=2762760 RepID=UPI001D04D1FB|nr:DUF4166 domain-containing protein [Pelagibius marinus]
MTLVADCAPASVAGPPPGGLALPAAQPAALLRRQPCRPVGTDGDRRYRDLMGERAWNALKPAVRRRFAKRLAFGQSVVYTGQITETRMNLAGRLLVQAARLIGSPFPLEPEARGEAAVVALTADCGSAGQHWTRLYAWRRGFPQIVHSSKRFAGPTGLEEYVGCGVGVGLTLHEENGGLRFRSAGYFLTAFGWRLDLPSWLAPGRMVIGHDDLGGGRFTFTLQLVHPWLGELLHQVSRFNDTGPAGSCSGPDIQEAQPCSPPCSPL